MEVLNLDVLPEEAKRELIDFYNTLIKKYKLNQILKKKNKDEIDNFFNKFDLDIEFNREEANARR